MCMPEAAWRKGAAFHVGHQNYGTLKNMLQLGLVLDSRLEQLKRLCWEVDQYVLMSMQYTSPVTECLCLKGKVESDPAPPESQHYIDKRGSGLSLSSRVLSS